MPVLTSRPLQDICVVENCQFVATSEWLYTRVFRAEVLETAFEVYFCALSASTSGLFDCQDKFTYLWNFQLFRP